MLTAGSPHKKERVEKELNISSCFWSEANPKGGYAYEHVVSSQTDAQDKRGMRIIGCIMVIAFSGVSIGHAQNGKIRSGLWHVHGWPEGIEMDWETIAIADSVQHVTKLLFQHLHSGGYYLASLDSMRIEAASTHLYIDPKPPLSLQDLSIEGNQVVSEEALRARMDLRPGKTWNADLLEADIQRLLLYYNRLGFPLAQISISSLEFTDEAVVRLALGLSITEGPKLQLAAIEIINADRVRPSYVRRVTGLRLGEQLVDYNPAGIQRKLLETSFFEAIDPPVLVPRDSNEVAIRITVKETPPGSFDLVLGLLPSGDGGVNLVGNGHLSLHNLFGHGRTMALKLDRLPGQVSSVEAHIRDPYVAGTPFSGEVRFEGYQQGSTYNQQRYGAEVGFRLPSGIEALTNLSSEQTRPGQDGLALVGTPPRQQIPRSSTVFYGIGFRYVRLDDALNPRKGWFLETRFERGRKERSNFLRTAEGDTTTERSAFRQERLTASTRVFVPTWKRQAWVLGGDAFALNSSVYDESDLFRFGGATSLRGYDEDRFIGRFVGRILTEYRYQVERQSFAYLFFDLGFVERPDLGNQAASRTTYPGFGLGIQFESGVGLINVSYALSSESGPTNGRIHVGLSFGL